MKAYFINVGHGNMSLVKTDNKNILIDCNITNDNDALKQINEVFDNKIIDIFIITHLHKDHMQGINALIDDGFEIKKVYESGFRYSADNDCAKEDLYKEVVKFLDDYNAEVPEPSTNAFVKDGDLNLYCLNSFRNTDIEDENIAIHYNCLVIKIEESNNSILYCGDTNREIWEDEIADEFKHLLETNILLASHHGSRTFFFNNGKNSDDEDAFEEHIENIIPEYTIISAKNNDEKKEGWPPHEEAINLYKKYTKESVEITGEKDTLIFELNDNGVVQGKHLRNSFINESIAGLYRKEKYIKISDSVKEIFENYRKKLPAKEAGGILLGRVVKNKYIIIESITEPNRFDISRFFGFIRNKKQAQTAINQSWKDSGGEIIYLGEWHTHNENIPAPSSQDIKTMNTLLLTSKIEINFLFLVIIGIQEDFVGVQTLLGLRKLNRAEDGSYILQ